MKRTTILFVFAATLLAGTAAVHAQVLEHSPAGCIMAGKMPVLQLNVTQAGKLRAYYRHANATDWCAVDGTNDGAISRVTLPKFNDGDEIEYFFVLLDGKRIIARSPQIYRVRATDGCSEGIVARNEILLAIDCSDNGNGSVPSSFGAGYALSSHRPPPHCPHGPEDEQ